MGQKVKSFLCRVACTALVLLGASVAHAQQPKTLQELERESRLQDALSTIDALSAKLDIHMKARVLACGRVVGYQPFCGCIMDSLPVAWSFEDYVAITSKSKEANGYSAMAQDLQRAYDAVAPIRDRCVKKINTR